VLADHADRAERQALMAAHRWQLLVLGVITGFMGAVPTLIWAMGALTLVLWLPMLALSVWLYTLVFAFSSLWFAHYLLAALQAQRARDTTLLADAVALNATPAVIPDLPGTGP
jgi:hypothetical protein